MGSLQRRLGELERSVLTPVSAAEHERAARARTKMREALARAAAARRGELTKEEAEIHESEMAALRTAQERRTHG